MFWISLLILWFELIGCSGRNMLYNFLLIFEFNYVIMGVDKLSGV